MAHLVDSSVWVALYLDTDINHKKAVALIDSMKGQLLIPYCVVNEVASVLAYKHSKEQAYAFLGLLRESSNVSFIDDQVEEEIEFYISLKARISFTDSTLLYFAKHLDADLITFDKQQAGLFKKI